MNEKGYDIKERRRMLEKEFEDIDKDHNGNINKQELFYYLDKCMQLANELFNKMEQNHDDMVSINEFIDVWLEAETRLRDNIYETDEEIEKAKEDKMKIAQLAQKYEVEEETLRKKSREAPPGELRVIVMEAKGIETDQTIVNIKVGSVRKQTIPEFGEHPVWEQGFSFKVSRELDEDIMIDLVGVNAPAAHQLELRIPIDQLKDQLKHTEWFDLYDVNGRLSDTKLRMAIQFIYSKAEYYQRMDKEWDAHIHKLKGDLHSYRSDLAVLNSSEKFLQGVTQGNFYVKKKVPTNNLIPEYGNGMRLRGAGGYYGGYHYREVEEFAPLPSNAYHPFRNFAYCMAFCFGFILLGFFVYRCMFVDLTVALLTGGCARFDAPQFVKLHLILFAGILLIQFLIDIWWLNVYPQHWWNGAYIDDGSLLFARRLENTISWFVLLFRLILLIMILRLIPIAKRFMPNYWNPVAKETSSYGENWLEKRKKPKARPNYQDLFLDLPDNLVTKKGDIAQMNADSRRERYAGQYRDNYGYGLNPEVGDYNLGGNTQLNQQEQPLF